jgi:hypothetical protein
MRDWKGMRIEGALASIIYPNMVCLTGESMEMSPKIGFSPSYISPKCVYKPYRTAF